LNSYPPKYNQIKNQQKMIRVIKKYPLATMISVYNGNPLITHLPVIYNDESGKLLGHIDKNNPQSKTLKDNMELSFIFKGPDTYISPSDYSTKQLPTWNYIIVHLKGKVTIIKQIEKAKQALVDMTNYLEAPNHQYRLDINDSKMDNAINYIQTFEIEILNWVGKFKLSQDKCKEDQERAKQKLIIESSKDYTRFINEMYL